MFCRTSNESVLSFILHLQRARISTQFGENHGHIFWWNRFTIPQPVVSGNLIGISQYILKINLEFFPFSHAIKASCIDTACFPDILIIFESRGETYFYNSIGVCQLSLPKNTTLEQGKIWCARKILIIILSLWVFRC